MDAAKLPRLHLKQIIFIVISFAEIILASIGPNAPGLSYEGKMCISIMLAGIVLWITESLPLPATALLVLIMMPIAGVCTFDEAFANTINSVVFFILGPFAFTVALDATTIPTRIAGAVLRWSGTNTRKMMFGVMGAVAVLSCVMSDVAACGVFISVVKRLLELNESEKGKSNLGKAMMIAVPWASYAGGCMVMTGNGCNVLTVNMFQQLFGIEITFVQWMVLGVPCGIIMLLVALFTVEKFFKPESMSQEAVEITIRESSELSPLTFAEKATVVIILAAIAGWIAGSWIPQLTTALVALVALIFLSVPGFCAIDFKTLVSRMNWGVILMIMCILSISHFMVVTGAGDWIVNGIVGGLPSTNPWIVLLVCSVIACLIHNVVPVGPAVVGMLAFPLGTIALQFGVSVSAMAMVVAWQASISYMLPLDCVPVLTYSTGYYKMSDMVKSGWVPSLGLVAYTVTLLPLLCMAAGLP